MTDKEYQEILALINMLEERLGTLQGKEFQEAIETIEGARALLKNYERAKVKPAKKKKAYFLPYKASMWDSLWGTWAEKRSDPEYETVVMPIPYYDRAEDFSFAAMHWEGDQFPKEVPITDYRNVNLADIHPDEIYIHNPYDSRNRVTSVAPEYYSNVLKRCTDKLVYIPYFVLNDNASDLKGNAHFATLPAVISADLVIVQSEKVREMYIEALVEEYGERTRSLWEAKISGAGSSKFDCAEQYQIEDIPEQWKRLIGIGTDSKKKVIFYNTSVWAFINAERRMLDKIKRVLDVFRSRQDHVVLLWRPHPLLVSTIEAMCPELLSEYKAIVQTFKDEAWGIFDDTADFNRAVAISDAVYGDNSSVATIFQKLKKPVMIQNVDI